jgi:putative acetyltransferase
MYQDLTIREATERDMPAVLAVHRGAFGRDEEARLVRALVDDPSARPYLSLVALAGDRVLGHILFTRAVLRNAPRTVSASLLAPLAVEPDAQGRGIGGRLIGDGLARLSEAGTELVFVLGWPDYYTRFGFTPAGSQGFAAPYPIPQKDADAWMVLALRENVLGTLQGRVVCANALDKPEYWKE